LIAAIIATPACRWGILRTMSATTAFAQRHASLWAVWPILFALLLVAALPAIAQTPDRVRLQLMWYPQAQFAGFYVARHKGFFAQERIAVDLIDGGPGISPVDVLAKGGADVALAWLPSAIDARMRGHNVVNIAQIFQRPGIAIVCRRDAGVQSVDDVAGKAIGVWNVSDELDVRYWLRTIGIPIDRVTLIEQKPDGQDLIEKRTACATVMMYNEYWSILRAGLPPSGLLHVRFADNGLGFLEDGLYVTASSLQDERRRDVLVRFLRATFAGWSYAKNNVEEAYAITMAEAPRADPVHQRRMLESILQLVGDTARIGLLDLAAYQHSIDVIAGQNGSPVRAAAAAGWTHQLWHDARLSGTNLFSLSEATRYYLSQTVGTRWFYLLDLVGTAAFGFAGFLRAQQRRYGLWGALVLTLLPAIGGGTLRDLLVGGDRYPPFIFKDPIYIYVVLGTLAFGTLLSRATAKNVGSRGFSRALAIFDAIGMATFTVIGAEVALMAGLNWFWTLFCAALTCAGGGMLLDIVTASEPRTFQGEPYEEIAVIGGVLLLTGLLIANRFEHEPSIVTGTILLTLVSVFTLRMIVVAFGLRSYRLSAAGTGK
jgi:NitT/TauT family transport system substrate-binding protein